MVYRGTGRPRILAIGRNVPHLAGLSSSGWNHGAATSNHAEPVGYNAGPTCTDGGFWEQTNKLVAHSGNQAEALAQAAEIAITQTRATINLVEAAQKSAEAAKISADLAARVSIPTLVVEKFEVGETGAANLEAFLQYPQISMTVKNCGQTPAFLKWWTVIFTADDLPDTPLYNKGPARGMVLEKVIVEPSRSYTLPALFFPYRTELPIKDVRAIIDRQATLSVYGFICYGDLFGSPLRRLKFCETALNLFDGPQPTINWFDFGELATLVLIRCPSKAHLWAEH